MNKEKFFCICIFIVSLLFSSCYKDTENDFFLSLNDNWEYSLTGNQDDFSSISTDDFHSLNSIPPHRRGYIYLKTTFDIPDEYSEKKLSVFFGIVAVAAEFYCNEKYIGSSGYFPPQSSFEKQQATSLILPSYLLKSKNNILEIKLWVDGYGLISTTPVISTERTINNITKQENFLNSKLFLISSCLMMLVCFIYLFFFCLRPKDKSNLSFSLLCFFSSLFLVNVCIGEYPLLFSDIKSMLIVEKIFNGYVPILTVYCAISFVRDFLGWKETRGWIIYRAIVTIIPIK